MLSRTAEYALRAVVHLAGKADQGPVRVDDVAAALSVPRNYLSKILHVLARAGVLSSTRGPGGGFVLAVPAGNLVLEDVVGHFDDLEGSGACLMGRKLCSEGNPCAAHQRWQHVSDTVRDFFRQTTVAELFEQPGVPRSDR